MNLRHWIVLQIVLAVADIATTPWHDMSLEANPIIRNYGILPMLIAKAISIWLFTVWWKVYDSMWWRRWLAFLGTAPVALTVIWNVVAIWRWGW